RDDDHLAICEELDVHREPPPVGTAHAPDRLAVEHSAIERRRLVARPRADRPRVDRWWRRPENDHGLPLPATLVTAAAEPATSASASSARLPVAESSDTTTPARNASSDPRLSAAAIAPSRPASCARRGCPARRSAMQTTTASPIPSPSCSRAAAPVGGAWR